VTGELRVAGEDSIIALCSVRVHERRTGPNRHRPFPLN
jgi:hypothetical protein